MSVVRLPPLRRAVPDAPGLVRLLRHPSSDRHAEPGGGATPCVYRVAGDALAPYGVRDGDDVVVRFGRSPRDGDLVATATSRLVVQRLAAPHAHAAQRDAVGDVSLWCFRAAKPAMFVTAFLTAIPRAPSHPVETGIVVAVRRRARSTRERLWTAAGERTERPGPAAPAGV